VKTLHKHRAQFSVSELFNRVPAQLKNVRDMSDQTAPAYCALASEKTGRHITLELPPKANSRAQTLAEAKDVITVAFDLLKDPDIIGWLDLILKAPSGDAIFRYICIQIGRMNPTIILSS
jgi:hypothetical protein